MFNRCCFCYHHMGRLMSWVRILFIVFGSQRTHDELGVTLKKTSVKLSFKEYPLHTHPLLLTLYILHHQNGHHLQMGTINSKIKCLVQFVYLQKIVDQTFKSRIVCVQRPCLYPCISCFQCPIVFGVRVKLGLLYLGKFYSKVISDMIKLIDRQNFLFLYQYYGRGSSY